MHKLLSLTVITLLFSLSTTTTTASEQAMSSGDTRKTIVLTEKERNLVLLEMRSFLEAVQKITVSLGKDDLEVVAKSAKQVGMTTQQAMPASLREKLPMAFKQLGMKTHKAFDQLALDAEDLEDKQLALEQLGGLMNHCVSCHASFRFDVEKTTQ